MAFSKRTLPQLLSFLSQRLTNKGSFSTQIALTGRSLIDKNDNIVFDPDDLPNSLAAILASAGAGAAIRAETGKQFSILGAGTAYTLTATPAQVDLGTTDPILTLANAGIYLILGVAQVSLTGATFAASRNVTLKLRRTNNTAADVTAGATVVPTGITTTITGPLQSVAILGLYTATAGDIIGLFGDVSVVPTAGSITVDSAKLVAVRIG